MRPLAKPKSPHRTSHHAARTGQTLLSVRRVAAPSADNAAIPPQVSTLRWWTDSRSCLLPLHMHHGPNTLGRLLPQRSDGRGRFAPLQIPRYRLTESALEGLARRPTDFMLDLG